MMQVAAAFTSVLGALNWFTDNYIRLAEWSASARRVDELYVALELVKRVLENQGALVTSVRSGDQALRLLESSTPDVLISDIGMPGMDGYQFMRRMRAAESKERRMPALALTAFARPDDRKHAILAGYQAHLAKPFDMAELAIVVAGLVGRT